jgi:predicted DNA-binding transcriptional regulator YafY
MSISAKIINNMQNGNFVQFERANFIKQTHLEELVEVCKNHEIISLQYENFWWGKLRYEVEPYLLKQFRNRWYVIAKITNIIKQENQNTRVKENEIYNFALDRILNIENTKKTFKAPNFDANEFYKDCFGIIKPSKSENETPQEIELCFEEIQGRYLKKLPLHHSQEILKERETKDHIFIRLKVYITYDFVQEILHFGETVKVIAPQSFKDKIMKEVSNQIVKYYDENDELLSRSDIY